LWLQGKRHFNKTKEDQAAHPKMPEPRSRITNNVKD